MHHQNDDNQIKLNVSEEEVLMEQSWARQSPICNKSESASSAMLEEKKKTNKEKKMRKLSVLFEVHLFLSHATSWLSSPFNNMLACRR